MTTSEGSLPMLAHPLFAESPVALVVPHGPAGRWLYRKVKGSDLDDGANVSNARRERIARINIEQSGYHKLRRVTNAPQHGNPTFEAAVATMRGAPLLQLKVTNRVLSVYDGSGVELGEVTNSARKARLGAQLQFFLPRSAPDSEHPLGVVDGGNTKPIDVVVNDADGTPVARISSPNEQVRRLDLDPSLTGVLRVLCVAAFCSTAGPVWTDVRQHSEGPGG